MTLRDQDLNEQGLTKGVAVKDEKPMVAGRTKRKASKMCFCEQCGAMITKEDYDNFGCVCASCAIENL